MTVRLSRLFVLTLLTMPTLAIAVVALQPSPSSIPPTSITISKPDATVGEIATLLSRASGIPTSVTPTMAREKCPVDFINVPFWEALEKVAKQTGTRIVITDKGTKAALEPRGKSQEVSAVNGPFRIVAKQVIGRALLDLGTTFHEVYLDIHWEPRIAVFRIDSQPGITKIIDDRSRALTAPTSSAGTYPTEATSEMRIRVNGLTRESKQIGILAGDFRVTAAEKMLSFRFADLTGKLPVAQTQNLVIATLKGIAKPDKTWDVEVELQYPNDHPAFESFEQQKWLRDNRVYLVSPNLKQTEPESEEVDVHGRKIVATYRFPGNLNPREKGWSLVYKTPSPLVEFKVPFELKNIPIP